MQTRIQDELEHVNDGYLIETRRVYIRIDKTGLAKRVFSMSRILQPRSAIPSSPY